LPVMTRTMPKRLDGPSSSVLRSATMATTTLESRFSPTIERSISAELAAFGRWMDEDKGYSLATRKSYREKMAAADRFLRSRFARALVRADEDHLRAYLATFRHSKTRNTQLNAVRAYFAFVGATRRRRKGDDPTVHLSRFREPLYLPRPLEAEQIRRLRVAAATMPLRYRVILDLALYAGPRRSEIAGLSWSDVDFVARRIRFLGKGTVEGVIPLHEHLAETLWQWRCLQPARDEWVFPSPSGGHLKPHSVYYAIRQIADVAGVDGCTTHRLRHTFATELLATGSDIRIVQELMRHRSLTSTQIYTKVEVHRLEVDLARVDFHRAGETPPRPRAPMPAKNGDADSDRTMEARPGVVPLKKTRPLGVRARKMVGGLP
jgi:site-specific recombinase XerD